MYDPIIEVDQLSGLASLQLLDASPALAAADAASTVIKLPMAAWITAARDPEVGFDRLDYWSEALGALGIDPDGHLVVLDDGRMSEAARAWFLLQYFGVPCRVLNGGHAALATLETPLDGGRKRHDAALRLRPAAGAVGLVQRDTLKVGAGRDVAVFDSRTPEEHSGEDLRGNPRGGRLPGARLLAHGDLLDGCRLKSATDLRQLIETTGFQDSDCIVAHCNGGGRGALAALAAARAGFEDVHLYYLGFADWSADPSCPLE
jgi:thiosulfate/3-mercaptopyruvate sulfurtransferase